MPLISTCQILVQEDNKVRGNLGYTVRHCLKGRIKRRREERKKRRGVVERKGGGEGRRKKGPEWF